MGTSEELYVNGDQNLEAQLIETESVPETKSYKRWICISIYVFCVLTCQAVATILERLYYENGGKSTWVVALVQLIGFPVLLIFRFISRIKQPVSTFSLILASQLAFTAFFSYFLNSQKFTPFIVNSLFLLTVSSALLVLNNESESTENVSGVSYVIGIISTMGASATIGLLLSLIQLIFRKVIKKHTFSSVTDMVIYQSLVASCLVLIGLFASGEWKTLTGEMSNYRSGKVSYVMTLICSAISWQFYTIGVVGLIFESSSVFSNTITAVGLPVVPVLAVIVFHDNMNSSKIISIILAIWGFLSFVYQHYLDDKELKISHGNPVEGLHLPVE